MSRHFFSIYFQWNLLHSFYEIIALNHFNLNDDHLSKLFFQKQKKSCKYAKICVVRRISAGTSQKHMKFLETKLKQARKKIDTDCAMRKNQNSPKTVERRK